MEAPYLEALVLPVCQALYKDYYVHYLISTSQQPINEPEALRD